MAKLHISPIFVQSYSIIWAIIMHCKGTC